MTIYQCKLVEIKYWTIINSAICYACFCVNSSNDCSIKVYESLCNNLHVANDCIILSVIMHVSLDN